MNVSSAYELRSVRNQLLDGNYLFIQKILPLGSLVGVIAGPLFYFVLSAAGLPDILFLRILVSVCFLVFLVLGKQLARRPRLFQVTWELTIAFAFPFVFTVLFIHTDYTQYWWVSLLFSGLFYGLLTGRFFCALFAFPATSLLAIYAYHHSLELLNPADISRQAGAFIIAWFTAVLASVIKAGAELFIMLKVKLHLEKIKAGSMERLKETAETNLRLERELRQAQKLESIGKLAAGVAHDFNNMLMVVTGQILILKKELPNPEQVTRLETIQKVIRRSSDLVQNLLVFARQTKAEMGPVDIHQLCAETLQLLSRSVDARIRIVEQYQASPSIITGDAGLLQNVILNIAVNGCQAMPRGGVLRVTTRTRPADSSRSGIADEILVLSISDTGIGMDEATKARIFEPLFTTKQVGQGTGMGLATVYGTMKAHHGTIEVETAPGKGTTFHLFFSLAEQQVAKTEVASAPISQNSPGQIESPGTGHVLVVDDDESVLVTVQEMLEDLGYTTTAVKSALEGIDSFRNHRCEIDAVLLDNNMPVLSGADSIEHFRSIDPSVPIILMSGKPLDGAACRAAESGSVSYLKKPFTDNELSQQIVSVLMGRDK